MGMIGHRVAPPGRAVAPPHGHSGEYAPWVAVSKFWRPSASLQLYCACNGIKIINRGCFLPVVVGVLLRGWLICVGVVRLRTAYCENGWDGQVSMRRGG